MSKKTPEELGHEFDEMTKGFGEASVDVSTCSAFELRGTNIHDAMTGKLICTILPERKASDEREDGESWLDMRERTAPEREAIERHTEDRAAKVCAFLNSQTSVSLERLTQIRFTQAAP